jgi:hypothetical protein
MGVVLHSTQAEAERAMQVLREATLGELARAIALKDGPRTYDLAWRLARCAGGEADVVLAAAALATSRHPESRAPLLGGYLPAPLRSDEHDHRLADARRQLARGRSPDSMARAARILRETGIQGRRVQT